MSLVNVQFSDATEKVVIAFFACPQDPDAYPNQGQIDDSDPMYLAFLNPAATLLDTQSAQIDALSASYSAAIQQSVSYTSKGGVTQTYQADGGSIQNLIQMLAAFQAPASPPAGFYWVSADNTQVPFTYADMQALAVVIGQQGFTSFQKLQTLKAAVNAATTIKAVQAIVWK